MFHIDNISICGGSIFYRGEQIFQGDEFLWIHKQGSFVWARSNDHLYAFEKSDQPMIFLVEYCYIARSIVVSSSKPKNMLIVDDVTYVLREKLYITSNHFLGSLEATGMKVVGDRFYYNDNLACFELKGLKKTAIQPNEYLPEILPRSVRVYITYLAL